MKVRFKHRSRSIHSPLTEERTRQSRSACPGFDAGLLRQVPAALEEGS
ncbi:MAG TPA: hypothetical protein VMV31_02670 [Terriglobales bacterium]|nr:hypothetical protein [Terriglobales bacterium]